MHQLLLLGSGLIRLRIWKLRGLESLLWWVFLDLSTSVFAFMETLMDFLMQSFLTGLLMVITIVNLWEFSMKAGEDLGGGWVQVCLATKVKRSL